MLSLMAFSAWLVDGQAPAWVLELDPFRRIDPEYEAQEPADDGDHEEAHNPQNCSGHGAGPRDARKGYPPTRQEVLQRET